MMTASSFHTVPEVKQFLFFLNLFYLATSADGLKNYSAFSNSSGGADILWKLSTF